MTAQVVPLSRASSRWRSPARVLSPSSGSTGVVEPPVSVEQVRTALVGLSAAVVHQQVVATAIGFLVAERRCTPRHALGVLLEVAARTDRPLFDVAYGLVVRHTRVHEGLVGFIAAAGDLPGHRGSA